MNELPLLLLFKSHCIASVKTQDTILITIYNYVIISHDDRILLTIIGEIRLDFNSV